VTAAIMESTISQGSSCAICDVVVALLFRRLIRQMMKNYWRLSGVVYDEASAKGVVDSSNNIV
jgi:hypothetical protein